MRMNELAARILGWANDRNLIEGSTVEKQFVKLVEEHGEYAAGLARGKLDVQADALGDMMVICIIMAAEADINLLSALCEEVGASDLDYDSAVACFLRNMEENGGMIGGASAFLMLTSRVGDLAGYVALSGSIEFRLMMVFGTVIANCIELGLQPSVVLEDVWNIIKDRKGKMVDGVFIKENDAMMLTGGNTQG